MKKANKSGLFGLFKSHSKVSNLSTNLSASLTGGMECELVHCCESPVSLSPGTPPAQPNATPIGASVPFTPRSQSEQFCSRFFLTLLIPRALPVLKFQAASVPFCFGL